MLSFNHPIYKLAPPFISFLILENPRPHLLETLGLSSFRRRRYDVTTDGRGFQSLFVVIILRVISPPPGLRPNYVHKT